MLNATLQVLLTHLRRARFAWMFIIPGVLCIVTGAFVANFPVLLLGSGTICGLLLVHLKTQFTRPQSALVPAYRWIHGAVTMGMLGFIVVAITCFTPLPSMRTALALAALVTCLSWWILEQTWILTVVLIGGWFWLTRTSLTPIFPAIPIERWIDELNLPARWGLLAGAIFVTTAALYRMSRLKEDDPAYHRTARGNQDLIQSLTTPAQAGKQTRREWFVGNLSPTQVKSLHNPGAWMRIVRWNLPFTGRFYMLFSGFGTGWVAIFLMGWITRGGPLFLAGVMPFIVAMAWAECLRALREHHRSLAWELTLPVERKSFFLQLQLSILLLVFKRWAALLLGVLVVMILLGHPIQVPSARRLENPVLILFVLVSSACLALTVAATFWAAHKRFKTWVTGLILIAFMPTTLLYTPPSLREAMGLSFWVSLSLLFVLIGALLAIDAHRRWMAADIV